jgi:hypothetical protein
MWAGNTWQTLRSRMKVSDARLQNLIRVNFKVAPGKVWV